VVAQLVARRHGPGRHARVLAYPLADRKKGGGNGQLVEEIE
jgi:hypothetical protein